MMNTKLPGLLTGLGKGSMQASSAPQKSAVVWKFLPQNIDKYMSG